MGNDRNREESHYHINSAKAQRITTNTQRLTLTPFRLQIRSRVDQDRRRTGPRTILTGWLQAEVLAGIPHTSKVSTTLMLEPTLLTTHGLRRIKQASHPQIRESKIDHRTSHLTQVIGQVPTL